MKTLANATAELIDTLAKIDFVPSPRDTAVIRLFDLKNNAGFPILRVAIAMSDATPEFASVYALNGTKAELICWTASFLPPEIPITAIIGLITGAQPTF